jgi:hypothetical protein
LVSPPPVPWRRQHACKPRAGNARSYTPIAHPATAKYRHAQTTTTRPQRSPSGPNTSPTTSSYLFDHLSKPTCRTYMLCATPPRAQSWKLSPWRTPWARITSPPGSPPTQLGSWRTKAANTSNESHSPDPGNAAFPRMNATQHLYNSARQAAARQTMHSTKLAKPLAR